MENKEEAKFEAGRTKRVTFHLKDKTTITFDIPDEYQHFEPEYAMILKLLDKVEELEKENSEIKMRLSRDYTNILNQMHNRINRLNSDFDARLRSRGM